MGMGGKQTILQVYHNFSATPSDLTVNLELFDDVRHAGLDVTTNHSVVKVRSTHTNVV